MDTIDFGPATSTLRSLVLAVPDVRLGAPTPCERLSVADLCDHIGGLSFAFTAAARKQPLGDEAASPRPDGSRLEEGWRQRIDAQLAELAGAWTDAGAYEGLTQAGPVELPGAVAARVALNEVVVHGWDLATALDRPYDVDPTSAQVCLEFVESFEPPADGPAEVPADEGGLFGPPIEVPHDAPVLHHLLGGTGRRPR